jgi:acylphosphatase
VNSGIGRRYIFYGRVQGVGFRFTTVRIAKNFKVTGYVKNLDDGTVELVVFGQETEIDKFINQIKSYFKTHITNISITPLPYNEHYKGFEIEY